MPSPRPELDAVLSSLTARERQIVDYVAAGRANKVIAIDLGISLRTVEAHRARIFAKLETRNAMQLACRLCEHVRSGASPVPGAQWDARVLPPGQPGAGAQVLHEPMRAYDCGDTGAQPPGTRCESGGHAGAGVNAGAADAGAGVDVSSSSSAGACADAGPDPDPDPDPDPGSGSGSGSDPDPILGAGAAGRSGPQ